MEVVATEVAATVASMAASEWEVVVTVAATSVVATAGWAMESVTVGEAMDGGDSNSSGDGSAGDGGGEGDGSGSECGGGGGGGGGEEDTGAGSGGGGHGGISDDGGDGGGDGDGGEGRIVVATAAVASGQRWPSRTLLAL